MADKKFGLSDALINAVRQVAENNAPLPRDERERDLARQARSNPKSLDEGLSPGQKLIARKRPPRDKIGANDLAALRGENMKEAKKLVDATTDKMLNDDPVAGAIAKAAVGSLRFVGKGLKKIVGKEEFQVRNSDDIVDEGFLDRLMGKKKPEEGDIAPKTLANKLNKQNENLPPKSKRPHPGQVGYDVKEETELDEGMAGHTATSERTEGGHRAIVKDSKGQTRYAGSSVYPTKKHAINGADIYIRNGGGEHGSDMERDYNKQVRFQTHVGGVDLGEAKLTAAQIRDQVAAGRALSKKPITPEERARAAARRASKSKAAQAAKVAAPPKPKKPQAYVSPDKPKGAENETPNDDTRDPRENIINQLRKQPVEGKHTITFRNGKTHLLSPAIVNKARTLHANMHPSKKGDFQERLAASLESFQDAVKNPENEAPKPKGKEALLAPKPLDKNFMKNLDRLAAAHNARKRAKGK